MDAYVILWQVATQVHLSWRWGGGARLKWGWHHGWKPFTFLPILQSFSWAGHLQYITLLWIFPNNFYPSSCLQSPPSTIVGTWDPLPPSHAATFYDTPFAMECSKQRGICWDFLWNVLSIHTLLFFYTSKGYSTFSLGAKFKMASAKKKLKQINLWLVHAKSKYSTIKSSTNTGYLRYKFYLIAALSTSVTKRWKVELKKGTKTIMVSLT